MPYKSTYSTRPKYRKKYSASSFKLAKKALRKVSILASRLKPEAKIHDIAQTTLTPGAAGIVTSLVVIAQGNTVITRDGLAIRPFFHEFRYAVTKHATPTTTSVRIIICRDNRQVESSAPAMLDVILQAVPISQYSRVNPGRFKILYNKLIMLRTNRIAMNQIVTRKLNFPIRYVGAANTTITKNGIFLITQSNAAGGQEPTIIFTYRLRFTDV